MSALNKQIKGSNLCGTKCSEKNTIIHPETNVSQVMLTTDTSTTLEEWILSITNEDTEQHISRYTNLLEWLQKNYPISSEGIPIATDDTIGGIKLGKANSYLQISNDGVLTFNEQSLPTIKQAKFEALGGIRLGNDSIMSKIIFSTTDITGNFNVYNPKSTEFYCFPLMNDDSRAQHAGIAIPQELFKTTQQQSDWNEDDIDSPTYILNKPSIPEGYVLPTANNETLGGIKVGYESTDYEKAIKLDVNNKAYVQLKVPAGAWVGNGLSQHYFEIVYSQNNYYVPLFKIEKNEPNNDFKVNIRFEIIGRHTTSYFGEFMINYRNEANYPKDLLMLNLVAPANARLAQNDIVATVNNEGTEMIVYRRMDATTGLVNSKENFIVNITGNNARGLNSTTDINRTTYYCTEAYDSEEKIITSSDFITTTITNVLNYIPTINNQNS